MTRKAHCPKPSNFRRREASVARAGDTVLGGSGASGSGRGAPWAKGHVAKHLRPMLTLFELPCHIESNCLQDS